MAPFLWRIIRRTAPPRPLPTSVWFSWGWRLGRPALGFVLVLRLNAHHPLQPGVAGVASMGMRRCSGDIDSWFFCYRGPARFTAPMHRRSFLGSSLLYRLIYSARAVSGASAIEIRDLSLGFARVLVSATRCPRKLEFAGSWMMGARWWSGNDALFSGKSPAAAASRPRMGK